MQCSSNEFARVSDYWGCKHETSSPHHQSGNGKAERAVQTIKNLMKKEEDPFLALLNYRSTPLECGKSPAELMMNRQIRNRIPLFQRKRRRIRLLEKRTNRLR